MEVISNKYSSVLSSLRKDIVRGVYQPGHRLPTRSEICDEFGLGIATVQRALNTLEEDGFVQTGARKSGTFVVDNPPHLCNYAIVIPKSGQWSKFYSALNKALQAVRNDTNRRFHEYHISGQVASHLQVEQLCHDVQHLRLAGLLFAGSPSGLKGTPVLDHPNIPRVVMHPYLEQGMPAVFLDMKSFFDKAIKYLRDKGCKRIGHLCIDFPWRRQEEFEQAIRDYGLETRPYWTQTIQVGPTLRGAAGIVHMMMQLEGDRRPDALVVYDDNLLEHAVAGLLAAGVRVPDELEVVSHCNFPAPSGEVLPITRIGFDHRVLLNECLQILAMQRSGETPPEVTAIPAIFEEDMEQDAVEEDLSANLYDAEDIAVDDAEQLSPEKRKLL